jgi:hypothetical protein
MGACEAIAADGYIDAALETLTRDEPILARWLHGDPDLDVALRGTMSAIYGVMRSDAQSGIPFELSLERIRTVIFRLMCAVAWGAATRDRASVN